MIHEWKKPRTNQGLNVPRPQHHMPMAQNYSGWWRKEASNKWHQLLALGSLASLTSSQSGSLPSSQRNSAHLSPTRPLRTTAASTWKSEKPTRPKLLLVFFRSHRALTSHKLYAPSIFFCPLSRDHISKWSQCHVTYFHLVLSDFFMHAWFEATVAVDPETYSRGVNYIYFYDLYVNISI